MRERRTPALTVPFAITRRAVVSWVLYDLANTIFSMGVVSVYFSLYVREEVGAQRADSVYGIITAVSMGIIFVVSPLLGAMTDRARRRMPFLVGSTLICCGCTALFARGPFAISAILFIVANAAYQAGVQFYDAMLPGGDNRGEPRPHRRHRRGRGVPGVVHRRGRRPAAAADELRAVLHDRRRALRAVRAAVRAVRPGAWQPEPAAGPWQRACWRTARADPRHAAAGAAVPGPAAVPGRARLLHRCRQHRHRVHDALHDQRRRSPPGSAQTKAGGRPATSCSSAISFAVAGGFAWGWVVDRIGPKRTLDGVLLAVDGDLRAGRSASGSCTCRSRSSTSSRRWRASPWAARGAPIAPTCCG